MDNSSSTMVFDGGFFDPVLGSQSVFRSIMDAFAHPGRIVDLEDRVHAPGPLDGAAATLLATLADYDTPIWFEASGAEDAAAWVTFQTGAPRTLDPQVTAFAVLEAGSAVEAWSQFSVGTSSYPDRSTTFLLPVADLHGGPRLQLIGPGIETAVNIGPHGLPDSFLTVMARNAAIFPLGFDLVLVCRTRLTALPRTTRITEA